MEKRFITAIATLIGTTIGAGILGIPYVVAQAGTPLGIANIILIGLAVILLNLYLAEVVLRTPGNHQLTGYAQRYLGKRGKLLMSVAMLVSIYGAMTAYIIGVGVALASIFPLSAFTFSILFFAAGSMVIRSGLKGVAKSEVILTGLTVLFLAVITFFSFFSESFNTAKFTPLNPSNFALPYGVVLFAFLGAVAVPEMSEELGRKKKLLKKAVIIAGLIPLIGYSIFALAVVGVTGIETTPIATIGLGHMIGERMILFANLFAVFAMSTSFLALGLALKEMYQYDYKINKSIAWLLTWILPISVFLLGANEFIPLVAIVGAVAGGIEGILIVLMHRKARKIGKRKPEFRVAERSILSGLLILLFIGGMAYAFFG